MEIKEKMVSEIYELLSTLIKADVATYREHHEKCSKCSCHDVVVSLCATYEKDGQCYDVYEVDGNIFSADDFSEALLQQFFHTTDGEIFKSLTFGLYCADCLNTVE